MLFNSYAFILVFLPITWLAFAFSEGKDRRLAIIVLSVSSLFFYAYWNPKYLILLLCSIAGNYALSIAIRRARRVRGWLVAGGIVLNLAVLGWFKYAFFAYSTLISSSGNADVLAGIILPLGISFYTFEQIAYLIDARRGTIPDRGPLTYGAFVIFFPHLIAGPIILYQDMAQQFLTRHTIGSIRLIKFHSGLILFAVGLFKKVVLADGFGSFAAAVFKHAATPGASIGSFDAWIGALAYSLQLYFDFSGYSDMAVGLARLFGYRLPFNFNSPYQATNIVEFWRRWHMTLTAFFRRYVYIPLGGNRAGLLRQSINIMTVFVLVGLWHGAGWAFILWGSIHGCLVLVTHLGLRLGRRRPDIWPSWFYHDRLRRPRAVFGWASTMLCVILLWVVFRAPNLDTAWHILGAMSNIVHPSEWSRSLLLSTSAAYQSATAMLVIGWSIVLFMPNSRAIAALLSSGKLLRLQRRVSGNAGPATFGLASRLGLNSILIGIVLYLAIATLGQVRSEFLYFQF